MNTPQRYQKRPLAVEAIRYTGDNLAEVNAFLGGPEQAKTKKSKLPGPRRGLHDGIVIHTLEGDMRADLGDWIIRGVKGEFYPCKDDVFRGTYDLIDDRETPRGAVIEVFERRNAPIEGMGGDIIIPNEIRINGHPVLTPAETPVKVHEVTMGASAAVLVTLTLYASRIVVAAREPGAAAVG